MSLFPTHQIAYMKRQAARFMKDRCAIHRPTDARDGYGNSLDGGLVVATDVPCRVLPKQRERQGEETVGEVESGRTYYDLIVLIGTDLQDGDWVHFGGDKYETLRVEDAHTDRIDFRASIVKLGE